MIIYKRKRRKKYFNRGAKQKYVKYFSATKQHRPVITTQSPFLNSFYILALMAGVSIFFLATFMLQNGSTLPKLRFEFSFPEIEVKNLTKTVSSIPNNISKSLSQIKPPALPKPEPIQAPKIQLPQLNLREGISAAIGSFIGAMTRFGNAINPLPLLTKILNNIARFVTIVIDSIAKFFMVIGEEIAGIATSVVRTVANFFVNLWHGILRLLSPLDPRPAYSASKSYVGEIFSPVRTTLRESKPFANLFGKAIVQTLHDIGAGFSVAFSFMRNN